MIDNERMFQILDGAHYVKVSGLIVYVWKGGETINVYNNEFESLDCFSSHNPTLDYVIRTIDKHLKEFVEC